MTTDANRLNDALTYLNMDGPVRDDMSVGEFMDVVTSILWVLARREYHRNRNVKSEADQPISKKGP